MVCKTAIFNIKQLWELNGSSRCHENVLQTVKEDYKMLIAHYEIWESFMYKHSESHSDHDYTTQ